MSAITSFEGLASYEELTDFSAQFNKNIRPLLDAVDKLRNLKVTSEGIPLPTIVVVGDQSSGKSSVLESLAGISLPRGQGISTRVPLVLRLQSCPEAESSICISYKDSLFKIGEDEILGAVDHATNALAGTGKGVTDIPISLHIKKPNAPDLTMIDLPGITRVPVHGQPKNIYEQIAAMIRHYVTPPETVILNVLSATTVDFCTCESVRISKEIDKLGERTLAVVTKVDRAPEGVHQKVTTDDVGIGLGYICVRNRTDEESSHEEARKVERVWFDTHPALSLLDKRLVGIPALAERLTTIQAGMIRLRLPAIEKEIQRALTQRQKELDSLVQHLPTDGEPIEWFLKKMHENTATMQDLMVYGNHDGYTDEKNMHYSARLEELLLNFRDKLCGCVSSLLTVSKTEDIEKRMIDMRGLSLPNVFPPTLLKSLVREEIEKVSDLCTGVVEDAHSCAARFALHVVHKSTSSFPILLKMYKQTAKKVFAETRETCLGFVYRTLAKEKSTLLTVNNIYTKNIGNIQSHLARLRSLQHNTSCYVDIAGVEDYIDFSELQAKTSEEYPVYNLAFDLKMTLVAYMGIVYARIADDISLELHYSLEGALLKGLDKGVLEASKGQDMAQLMQEDSLHLRRRTNLRKRVEVLEDCKEVLSNVL